MTLPTSPDAPLYQINLWAKPVEVGTISTQIGRKLERAASKVSSIGGAPDQSRAN